MAIGSPQWMYSSGSYEIDQSLRFNDDDSAYLSWTPASAGNRKTWTWSAWVKRGNNTTQRMFHAYSSGNRSEWVFTGDTARFSIGGSSSYNITTNQVFRDPSAWYHILWSVDTSQSTESDRVNIYVNGEKLTSFSAEAYPTLNYESEINSATQHEISSYDGSGHFYDGYLAEINFIDGQQLTPADFGETGTYGEWKPIEYSGTYGTNGFYLPFKQDYTVEGFSTITWKGNSTNNRYFGGTGFKPDLIWAKARSIGYSHSLYDSVRGYGSVHNLVTNTTEAENGGNHVYGGIASSSADGFTTFVGSDGGNPYANNNEDGKTYVAWNWDMGADTPTGFGCVTYTGNAVDGREISGVGFQPDLVWIKQRNATYSHVLANAISGDNKYLISEGTYAEDTDSTKFQTFTKDGFKVGTHAGVNSNGSTYVAWGWDMGNTTVTNTSGSITSTVRANPAYGQSIVSFNAGSAGTAGHGLSAAPEIIFQKSTDAASYWWVGTTVIDGSMDFLQLNSTDAKSDSGYAAPTSSVISNIQFTGTGNNIAYCFHSVTGYSKIGSFSGTGSANNSVTGLGFRPSWIMVKRTDSADQWLIVDSTRTPLGDTTGNNLYAESSSAEVGGTSTAIQFDSNGFTVKGIDTMVNASGGTYIYMAFAGGMDSISDYNTDGSIDSRVKANPTYGQSIVSYEATGSAGTIGHGLSSAPEMMIVKHRDQAATSWVVYNHQMATSNSHHKYLRLNQTVALIDDINAWNDTAPTSSVFSVGPNGGDTNNSLGGSTIAYLWHSVSGYSSIGRYSGNGSATGPSVTTGFRPAWIMIKGSTVAENWNVIDATRSPTNVGNKARLQANASTAEGATWACDFNDNGFQIKSTDGEVNTNGEYYIYMAFADKREYAYWLDQSGNNNDWTSNNLTESDISVDSPSNNFATLNPIDTNTSGQMAVSEGNLQVTHPASGAWDNVKGTFGVSSGKWYWEVNFVSGLMTDIMTGICDTSASNRNGQAWVTGSLLWYNHIGGELRVNGTDTSANYGLLTDGDILGIALNMDDKQITFYKNNVALVTNYSIDSNITTATAYTLQDYDAIQVFNFGQDSSFAGNKVAQGNQDSNDIGDFYYTPPTGFLALCTKNLPDVDVVPSEHFDVVTYTGTGSGQAVAVNFQPDFSWIKVRSITDSAVISDAVRGATKVLFTAFTDAEADNSAFVSAFTSTGLTLGGNRGTSQSGETYVAWNLKANGSGSSNTNGTITSTVSANVDAGFSIVSYTGNGSSSATIGHGLSKAPEMVIVKSRDLASTNWLTAINVTGSYIDLNLNDTSANSNAGDGDYFAQAFTSTTFKPNVNGSNPTNGNGNTYISYCFHSVDGYSKVGSYTGNGSTDGTFVYTGFRPAYVMIKVTNITNRWVILDNKRPDYNPPTTEINPNSSSAEYGSTANMDFLSNGFKLRRTGDVFNTDGYNYIYIAFAETPFKYSNAR